MWEKKIRSQTKQLVRISRKNFWEKREKKPREELGRENPSIFAVEFAEIR